MTSSTNSRICFTLLTAAFVASLSGCANMSTASDVSTQDGKIVKDEYYGPGGMRDYKKDKDKEALLKAKEACQDAQINLVEAKAANDVALIEQLKRKINKVCAENLKNKENQK